MRGADSIVQSQRERLLRADAERAGDPFLVHRDAYGSRLISRLDPQRPTIIGRGPDADVDIAFDTEVSRTHAEIHPTEKEWILIDDGLSRNGTFVNNERVTTEWPLRGGDVIRIGRGELRFVDPATSVADPEAAGETVPEPPLSIEPGPQPHEPDPVGDTAPEAPLSVEPASQPQEPEAAKPNDAQLEVLIALCRPYGDGSESAVPASDLEIAKQLQLDVGAVSEALRAHSERFGVPGTSQQADRVRLSELALRSGTVTLRDIGAIDD